MATERADDLKALMHDNATFIQFPPIGSSTSLITVIGDNRVNVQRTIRSIMQLVCFDVCALPCASDLLNSPRHTGLPILRRLFVAAARPIQCSYALDKPESFAGFSDSEAGVLRVRGRNSLQGHVFRNAWLGTRSSCCRFHAP